MKKEILYAGLDVDDQAYHFFGYSKTTGETIEFKCFPSVSNLEKKLQKFEAERFEIRMCYEASYLGFSLQRTLSKKGYLVEVIAPSLIPEISSKKIKTDKLDAEKLARYYSNDLLTVVHVPTEENEADRDLVRTRKFLMDQLIATKNHINSFCRKLSLDFKKETKLKSLWTKTYMVWLEEKVGSLEIRSQKTLLTSLLQSYFSLENQIEALEMEIEKLAATEKYSKSVSYLNCFRGLKTLSSLTIVLELGDIRRFKHPNQLTSYSGLDISENTSGGKEKKFGITKMGNRHVRVTVVEACQYATHPIRAGRALRERRKLANEEAIQIADRCMRRLYKKGQHLHFKGKHTNKIKVACAREMLGFIWEALNKAA
ncbi:MAG: IS110 family transposase [Pseudobdellovibrionaceae bacterium]